MMEDTPYAKSLILKRSDLEVLVALPWVESPMVGPNDTPTPVVVMVYRLYQWISSDGWNEYRFVGVRYG